MRTAMLADYLVKAGHNVVRWASSFDHGTKTQRVAKDTLLTVHPRYKIWLLHSPPYRRNVSLARIRNHRALAARFRKLSELESRPDLIVCSLPTLELADAVTAYATRMAIPIVIDVRDMWPDVVRFRSPRRARPALNLLLRGMEQMADRICVRASAITAHAPGFVDWGLARANRAATELDRSFPFGYDDRQPPRSTIADASDFWTRHGLHDQHQDLVVSYVGTLSNQLEFEPVLEAARRLVSRDDITFVLCGTGDMMEAMRRSTESLSNVLLPGWVSLPQSWLLLRRSSIGLVPLKGTPDFLLSVPNKVAEYMAAGLPLAVGFETGLVCDLVEANACGFSYAQRADSLVERLLALDADRDALAGMSRNASALYSRQFRADHIYPDFVRHLERVAGAKGAPETFDSGIALGRQP